MLISDGCEASDPVEPAFGCDHRSPEGKSHPFEPLRHQDSGEKIARRSDGFELRAEISFGDPAIEAGNETGTRIGEWGDDFAQIPRPDPHIAIADDQDGIPRFAEQPSKFVD